MTSHSPRKRFGQHFLHDPGVIRRIVDSLAIGDGETWIEVGPGLGALTKELPASIGRLYLIEIDRDLAAQLESQFGRRTNVTILTRDILKVDLGKLRPPGQALRIVGNLPYNISTPLFFHLARYAGCIHDMTFMVQKEVAQRLSAAPASKAYGRLSLSAGLRFETSKLFDVGPGAFTPPPRVYSSVIRMRPRSSLPPAVVQDSFDLLVRIAFSQRRKTLKKSIGARVGAESFKQSGIDPGLRPEALSVAEFVKLAQTCTDVH